MPRKRTATESGKAPPSKRVKAQAKKPKQPGSRDLVDHALMRGLSHPLRTRMLAILNERISSPNLLSKELNEGLSQVSYHIGVLTKLKLIELVKTEPRRGAVEHFYRGVRPFLISKDVWRNLPESILAGISAKILRNFFDDARASVEAGIFDDPDSYAGWSPLIMDREGFQSIDEISKEYLEKIFDAQAEASKRLVESGEKGFSVTVALASFLSTRSPEESKRATTTMQR